MCLAKSHGMGQQQQQRAMLTGVVYANAAAQLMKMIYVSSAHQANNTADIDSASSLYHDYVSLHFYQKCLHLKMHFPSRPSWRTASTDSNATRTAGLELEGRQPTRTRRPSRLPVGPLATRAGGARARPRRATRARDTTVDSDRRAMRGRCNSDGRLGRPSSTGRDCTGRDSTRAVSGVTPPLPHE